MMTGLPKPTCPSMIRFLVGEGGLELPPLRGHGPQPCASACSATRPCYALNLRNAVLPSCSGFIKAAQIAGDAAIGGHGDWGQLSRKPFWIRFGSAVLIYGHHCRRPPEWPTNRAAAPSGASSRRPGGPQPRRRARRRLTLVRRGPRADALEARSGGRRLDAADAGVVRLSRCARPARR